MLEDIVQKPVPMKDFFSPEANQFLSQLLERDPEKRLGNGPNGVQNIMSHPFFRTINWVDLKEKKVKPPYRPATRGQDDVRMIDAVFTDEKAEETPNAHSIDKNTKNKTKFKGFTYDENELTK